MMKWDSPNERTKLWLRPFIATKKNLKPQVNSYYATLTVIPNAEAVEKRAAVDKIENFIVISFYFIFSDSLNGGFVYWFIYCTVPVPLLRWRSNKEEKQRIDNRHDNKRKGEKWWWCVSYFFTYTYLREFESAFHSFSSHQCSNVLEYYRR